METCFSLISVSVNTYWSIGFPGWKTSHPSYFGVHQIAGPVSLFLESKYHKVWYTIQATYQCRLPKEIDLFSQVLVTIILFPYHSPIFCWFAVIPMFFHVASSNLDAVTIAPPAKGVCRVTIWAMPKTNWNISRILVGFRADCQLMA